ncbi:hypothetical protein IWZ01DRAFT_559296, partial [Phyllosticta capitalensis]
WRLRLSTSYSCSPSSPSPSARALRSRRNCTDRTLPPSSTCSASIALTTPRTFRWSLSPVVSTTPRTSPARTPLRLTTPRSPTPPTTTATRKTPTPTPAARCSTRASSGGSPPPQSSLTSIWASASSLSTIGSAVGFVAWWSCFSCPSSELMPGVAGMRPLSSRCCWSCRFWFRSRRGEGVEGIAARYDGLWWFCLVVGRLWGWKGDKGCVFRS